MNFARRLKLYGFGFAVGCLIVVMMFGNRSCVSTSEMKMQELLYQPLKLSDRARCKLKCLKKNEFLLKLELKQFEVNYDLTKVHQEPCGEYYIQPQEKYKKNYNYQLIIYDCDSISRIDDISINSSTPQCQCP